MPLLHKKLSVIVFWLTFAQLQLIRWLLDWLVAALLTDLLTSLLTSLLTNWLANWFNYWLARLQNSPYFCVFKYAQVFKQKVWNEAEETESETWGETLKIRFFFSLASQALWACEARVLHACKTLMARFTDFFTDFEKKPDCFAVYWLADWLTDCGW